MKGGIVSFSKAVPFHYKNAADLCPIIIGITHKAVVGDCDVTYLNVKWTKFTNQLTRNITYKINSKTNEVRYVR